MVGRGQVNSENSNSDLTLSTQMIVDKVKTLPDARAHEVLDILDEANEALGFVREKLREAAKLAWSS